MDRRYPSDAEELEELRAPDQAQAQATGDAGLRTLVPAGGVGPLSSGAQYHKVSQGTPIHGLISSAPQSVQIDAITRGGTISSDGVTMRLDPEAIPELSGQTMKVLIMYLSRASEQLPPGDEITAERIQRSRALSITLEEYMRACRIRDKSSARDQLNSAVRALYGISFEWDEKEWIVPDGKKRSVQENIHHRMRFTDHTLTREEGNPVKRGAAEIRLSFDMAEYLAKKYIMSYPAALLTVNTHKNPYSIPLGWKLCALDNVNITNNHPGRVGKTTVKTLLRAAKGIPRYETIAKRGNIYDLLIRPFDRDMRALVEAGVLSYYYYLDDDGNRVDSVASLTYAEFSALRIEYQIQDYPDQLPRLEAKQKRHGKTRRADREAQDAEDQTHAEDSDAETERE